MGDRKRQVNPYRGLGNVTDLHFGGGVDVEVVVGVSSESQGMTLRVGLLSGRDEPLESQVSTRK